MLTPKQKQILDFVRNRISKKRLAPTHKEIAKRFHLSSVATVHEHLAALEKKGYLTKHRGQARAIAPSTESENLISIPLLGTIAAGEPIEAIQETESIAVPESKVTKGADIYALRVSGESMVDENINDGDIVVVKNQSTAENGQKVVALIDESEATLKKFYREKGKIRLQPANQNLQPITVLPSQLTIQGIVLDVIKTSKKEAADYQPDVRATETMVRPTNAFRKIKISHRYDKMADAVLYHGDCIELMRSMPDRSVKLVVTSPPYNIGKEYEKRRNLDLYLAEQEKTIKEATRILKDDGSICWQVGNHIGKDGEVFPLDALIYIIGKKFGLKLRNRIIWRFGHGLHCTKRFSGRHETIVWFTKGDKYTFNLDPVRIPQKYPGKKNFKRNERYGTLSGNPLGKNPEDVAQFQRDLEAQYALRGAPTSTEGRSRRYPLRQSRRGNRC